MSISENRATVIISRIARIVAIAVSVSLPLVYYAISYQYQVAAIQTEAEINARIATQLINANPEMWIYMEERMEDLLARRPSKDYKEVRRILDTNDKVIFESHEQLDAPILRRSSLLFDSGTVVGRIEISRSLRALLMRTGLVAIFGLILGLGIFIVIRVLPSLALRQVLESLSNEKEKLAVTLGSIGDCVVTTDTDGRIVLINKVAEDLSGFSHEEAAGRPFPEVFHIIHEKTRGQRENLVEKVLRSDEIVEYSHNSILIARGGTERTIAASGACIRDDNSKVIGVVLVLRDITEKQKMQAELVKSQQLESIGILAGGIAHDFNNLLTAILGNISLAKAYVKPGEKAFEKLTESEKASLQAKDLTKQLLTFSKGGAPIKKTTSISEVVKDSTRFALRGSNVRCEYFLVEDLWLTEADEGQLRQVFHNLVINAQQAMPEGGTITISAENVVVGVKEMVPLNEGRYVKITIEDNGTGIPEEHISKVFDPYFSTKAKGSGLGLSITYSIIKSHDGLISVKSEIGVGTTFFIYFPASNQEILIEKETKENTVSGMGKILIMDDEELVRDVAADMLSFVGYQTELACDGLEAIELYKKAREAGQPFDAVIMDLTIPGGMGGKQAIGKLLEIDPEVKAVVSSGYGNDPIMSDFRQYGFSGFLPKPYKIEELSKALHKVICDEKEQS
jgi:PAS domain S-box-containing protein